MLAVVLTFYKWSDDDAFAEKYKHLFKRELELEASGAILKPMIIEKEHLK